MESYSRELKGRWISVVDENYSTLIVDATTLEFREDGSLLYTAIGERTAITFYYRANAHVIDLISPGQNRTLQIPFKFAFDGKLLLTFRWGCYVYAKWTGTVTPFPSKQLLEAAH